MLGNSCKKHSVLDNYLYLAVIVYFYHRGRGETIFKFSVQQSLTCVQPSLMAYILSLDEMDKTTDSNSSMDKACGHDDDFMHTISNLNSICYHKIPH